MTLLADIRIAEQGTFITGPSTGMLLADLGAAVTKIEQPGGDPLRGYSTGSDSAHFLAYNRGKRSIELDIKNSADLLTFDEIIKNSDVYIQNFRCGVAEKMGVGWERLKTLNPNLIYCSITGFGSYGPSSGRATYDTVAQAESGYLDQVIDRNAPTIVGPAVADSVTGLYAANAILAALIKKQRDGGGIKIEVSMLEAMMHFNIDAFTQYISKGVIPTPSTRPDSSQSYVVTCSDHLLLALHLSAVPKFWNALTEALERSDLLTDERWATREARIKNKIGLMPLLNKTFGERTRKAWCERLEKFGVPYAPVNTIPETLADPHVKALKIEVNTRDGLFKTIRSPISVNGEHLPIERRPPTLNEHRNEIIGEITRK